MLGYKALWQPRDAGSAQAASPVPGSPAGSCLKLFLRSVRLHILASLGKDVFTKFSVQLHGLRLFQLVSQWALLMGQVHTACFFGLKVETTGKGPSPLLSPSLSFSIPLKWRQGCPVGLVELLSVKTLNTEPF